MKSIMWRMIVVCTFSLLFTGCSQPEKDLEYKKEPQITISVEGGSIQIPAYQGTYSWRSKDQAVHADYPAPYELVKGKSIPSVSPEVKLNIGYDYQPEKGSISVNLWVDKNPVGQQVVESNKIIVPREKGIYIYDTVGSWREGTRSYAFAVEVR